MLANEVFICYNNGCRTVRSGATLELRQWSKYLWRTHYLLEGVFLLELRIRIVCGVQMVLIRDLCKVLGLCAKFLHVLDPGIAKHLSGDGLCGKACTIDDYQINNLNILNIILDRISVFCKSLNRMIYLSFQDIFYGLS